jgi:hypothetical protein
MKINSELAKLPRIVEQIITTSKNTVAITKKGLQEAYKSGEDVSMYLTNSLQNSLVADLSESESIDK